MEDQVGTIQLNGIESGKILLRHVERQLKKRIRLSKPCCSCRVTSIAR